MLRQWNTCSKPNSNIRPGIVRVRQSERQASVHVTIVQYCGFKAHRMAKPPKLRPSKQGEGLGLTSLDSKKFSRVKWPIRQQRPVTAHATRVRRSSPFPWSWASSELTCSVMDDRPHLFDNLPLPSRFSHWYQLTLLGDRGTRVWTTFLKLLRSCARVGVEHVISRSLVRRSTHSATASQEI